MTLALGLRVKTGRALCVALTGTRASPTAVLREEVYLADPSDPDTVHPYHLALDGEEAAAEAAANLARTTGAGALRSLIARLETPPTAVCVVVNSHTPPERIASPHMRAHSLEGWLFREICEACATELGLEPDTRAQPELKAELAGGAAAMKTLGAQLGPPWHADFKLAAIAAWARL